MAKELIPTLIPSHPPIVGRAQEIYVPPPDPDALRVPAPEPRLSATELFRLAGENK